MCAYLQILKIFWKYLWNSISTKKESHLIDERQIWAELRYPQKPELDFTLKSKLIKCVSKIQD